MRDNLLPPRIPTPPREYDSAAFARAFDDIYTVLFSLLQEGPIRAQNVYAHKVILGSTDGDPTITGSAATPESVVTAPAGSIHVTFDGDTKIYTKDSGSGNTGWVLRVTFEV